MTGLLHALVLDVLTNAGEAGSVVGLVQDEAFELRDTEVVERGDHLEDVRRARPEVRPIGLP